MAALIRVLDARHLAKVQAAVRQTCECEVEPSESDGSHPRATFVWRRGSGLTVYLAEDLVKNHGTDVLADTLRRVHQNTEEEDS